MPNENQPVQVSSRVQELGSLFAAPLVSVIEADVLAAKEFTRFLRDFGFVSEASPGGEGEAHLGALKTVTFSYKRPSPGGLEDAVVEIPLLSLVPLPLLQVTDAEFSFNVRVLESDSSGLGAPPSLVGNPEAAQTPDAQESTSTPPRPRVRAMLAQAPSAERADGAQRRSELDANMQVRLSMRQADVPGGISALLNLMNQSITSTSGKTQPES